MSRLPGLNQATAAFVVTASLVMTLFADRALAKEPLSPALLSAIMVIMGGDLDSDGDGVSDLDDQFPRTPANPPIPTVMALAITPMHSQPMVVKPSILTAIRSEIMQMPTMTVMASMMSMTRNPS